MKPHLRRLAHYTLLGWIAMLGIDYLLHGGILAGWYARPDPFLLDAPEAFNRIPLAYVGLLILAAFVAWLYDRLDTWGGGPGYRMGLVLGGVLWGAWLLGLASITTAPVPLLLGWFVGQALELGVAGAVIGSARSRDRLAPLWGRVIGLLVACVIITIILQSTGVAPSLHISP